MQRSSEAPVVEEEEEEEEEAGSYLDSALESSLTEKLAPMLSALSDSKDFPNPSHETCINPCSNPNWIQRIARRLHIKAVFRRRWN